MNLIVNAMSQNRFRYRDATVSQSTSKGQIGPFLYFRCPHASTPYIMCPFWRGSHSDKERMKLAVPLSYEWRLLESSVERTGNR
jgi:hypothetical protein